MLQLDALQPAQELPEPANGVDSPDSSLENEAKVDNLRFAGCWQRGQVASPLAWLTGRICSNFRSQSGQ